MITEKDALPLIPKFSQDILKLVNKYIPDIQDQEGRSIRAIYFNTVQTMFLQYMKGCSVKGRKRKY